MVLWYCGTVVVSSHGLPGLVWPGQLSGTPNSQHFCFLCCVASQPPCLPPSLILVLLSLAKHKHKCFIYHLCSMYDVCYHLSIKLNSIGILIMTLSISILLLYPLSLLLRTKNDKFLDIMRNINLISLFSEI